MGDLENWRQTSTSPLLMTGGIRGPISLHIDGPGSILCVGAHSDDIEIGAYGTLARLLAANPDLKVHWVVLAAPGDRRGEAEASAQALAGEALGSLRVLDFPERYLPYEPAVKRFFDELGADLDPDLVLCPATTDFHQDHRTAAQLTWNTFRDHLILEYEIVKYEGDLRTPNFYVPLTTAQIEAKVEHLTKSFPSQSDRFWFTPETFTGLARIRGIEARAADGYAEGFHVRKVVWR